MDRPGLDSWESWAATDMPQLSKEDLAALDLWDSDETCRQLLRDTIAILGLDGIYLATENALPFFLLCV